MIGIVMFFVALFALLLGFPVAFTFGGIALIFGVWAEGIEMFGVYAISDTVHYGKHSINGCTSVCFYGVSFTKDSTS